MVTRDMTVVRIGTDSSGRGIYMTKWMWEVHKAILRHPLVAPFAWKIVIVQGAFMLRNGGGAADSSGVHNFAGCLDIRTWNLTTAEIDAWVRASRICAFPYWRRDQSWQHGGMPEHAHGVLGTDSPMSSGSLTSWRSYVAGGDGLAGPGRDYEWRPSPLVLVTPPELLKEGWLMADDAARIERKIDKLSEDLNTFRENEWKRDKAAADKAKAVAGRVIKKLGGIQDRLTEIEQALAKGEFDKAREMTLALTKENTLFLKNDPDIDGVDNPADREEPADG